MTEVRHRWLWLSLLGLAMLVGCTFVAEAFFPRLVYYTSLPAIAATQIFARLTRPKDKGGGPAS